MATHGRYAQTPDNQLIETACRTLRVFFFKPPGYLYSHTIIKANYNLVIFLKMLSYLFKDREYPKKGLGGSGNNARIASSLVLLFYHT